MSSHSNRLRFVALLGVALLCALPAWVSAQPKKPVTYDYGGKVVVLQVGVGETFPTTSDKPIPTDGGPDAEKTEVVTVEGYKDNPAYFRIIGKAAGVSRVRVRDANSAVLNYTVYVVTWDPIRLRDLIRRSTASNEIQVLPAGATGVVVYGTVDRPEEIQPIVDLVRSVTGQTVASHIRVGGVQQVQLDVVVATVSRNELRAMAFNFLSNSKNFYLGSTVGQAVVNPALVGTGGTLNATFATGQALSGTPGFPNGLPTNILSGVLHDSWGFLTFLQALRTEGVLKLMAEPRLVTMSGRQASFLSGGEQAVPVPAGLGQVGVQFEEFGTRLNFVPVVLGNGKIHLEVEPEVSALDPASGTVIGGTTVPGRVTQRVRTTVELEAGQTFVIGGLIQHTVNASTIKTPILGDLPFIGAAFSNKSYNESELEVLILVTPHFVDPMDCAQAPKVLPGQETRTPDDLELFLEGILEAPRGPREVFPNKTYEAAYKRSLTAGQFPCAGHDDWSGFRDGFGNRPFGRGCATCPTSASGMMDKPAAKMPQSLPMEAGTTPSPTIPGALPASLELPDQQ